MGRLARAHDGQSLVLTGARRTTVARHQSVPQSIQWSLGLCSQAERTAWARLSVFPGSFCLDAATARDRFSICVPGRSASFAGCASASCGAEA